MSDTIRKPRDADHVEEMADRRTRNRDSKKYRKLHTIPTTGVVILRPASLRRKQAGILRLSKSRGRVTVASRHRKA